MDHFLADEVVDGTPGQMTDVRWALTDHQGSVRDLVVFDDAGTGELGDDGVTLADHVVYDAFGNVASETSPALARLFGYTARPFDPATGLQNNLHRWYDPATGRWLSEDPIGFNGDSNNVYRYCGNSAPNWVDPLGYDLTISTGTSQSISFSVLNDWTYTTDAFDQKNNPPLDMSSVFAPISCDRLLDLMEINDLCSEDDYYDPIHPDVIIWTPEIPMAWWPPLEGPGLDVWIQGAAASPAPLETVWARISTVNCPGWVGCATGIISANGEQSIVIGDKTIPGYLFTRDIPECVHAPTHTFISATSDAGLLMSHVKDPVIRDNLWEVVQETQALWPYVCASWGADACQRWQYYLRETIVDLGEQHWKNDEYTISYAEWTFPPKNGWVEHQALVITFADGAVAYLDNGVLGGPDAISFPSIVPKPWRPGADYGDSLMPGHPRPSRQIIENAFQNIENLWDGLW